MNDNLGNRMKDQYEDRTRFFLPRRTYTIIRIDGKAFHTYTARMEKPFDYALMVRMAGAAKTLCAEAQAARFAYLQSDECSILLTDFERIASEAWFDGNIQKIASVSASIFTAAFADPYARFDARVFTIPDRIEVENYFIWRQKDWFRNAVQMMAQSLYSQKQLHGKSCEDMRGMIRERNGSEWDSALVDEAKNGNLVVRTPEVGVVVQPAFIFTQERERLTGMIPVHGYD